VDALTELSYALDSMLEAGMVRAKNTAEILTKNISLFAVASIMYMLYGYSIMYPAEAVNAWWPGIGSILGNSDNAAADVIASGGDTYYSGLSDFFPGGVRGNCHVDRLRRHS
jgi:Amt family ammonium transporter